MTATVFVGRRIHVDPLAQQGELRDEMIAPKSVEIKK